MSNHHSSAHGMRWRIVGRLEAGLCQVQIYREFSLTPSVIRDLWKLFPDSGSIERNFGGGTASQLTRYLYAATGTRVSRMTVSKRLHQRGLFTRRPAVCVQLTSTNGRVPLAWCKQYRNWSMDQWVTVLFTDESCFT
ncbi:transposable element Tcb2 transposase [Trichonephila clavipes]|nr:transposable element Tcb2 transposase [Trichonephila clavipes]